MFGITRMPDGSFCLRVDVEDGSVARSVAALVETLALGEDWGHVQLNLAGVSFVDATGVVAMQFLMARGVEIINMTALVDAPLEGNGPQRTDTARTLVPPRHAKG